MGCSLATAIFLRRRKIACALAPQHYMATESGAIQRRSKATHTRYLFRKPRLRTFVFHEKGPDVRCESLCFPTSHLDLIEHEQMTLCASCESSNKAQRDICSWAPLKTGCFGHSLHKVSFPRKRESSVCRHLLNRDPHWSLPSRKRGWG